MKKYFSLCCLFLLCLVYPKTVDADPAPIIKDIIWTLEFQTTKTHNLYQLLDSGAAIPNCGFGLNCVQNPITFTTNNKYEFTSIHCTTTGEVFILSIRCDRFQNDSNVAVLIVNHAFGNVMLTLNCSNL